MLPLDVSEVQRATFSLMNSCKNTRSQYLPLSRSIAAKDEIQPPQKRRKLLKETSQRTLPKKLPAFMLVAIKNEKDKAVAHKTTSTMNDSIYLQPQLSGKNSTFSAKGQLNEDQMQMTELSSSALSNQSHLKENYHVVQLQVEPYSKQSQILTVQACGSEFKD